MRFFHKKQSGFIMLAMAFVVGVFAGCTPQSKTVVPLDGSEAAVAAEATQGFPTPNPNAKHDASRSASKQKLVALGKPFPKLAMTDVKGTKYSMEKLRGQLPLFIFVDTTCPCVRAYDERVQALNAKYKARGLQVIYIFSQPHETKAQAVDFATQQGYNWTVVRDEGQKLMYEFDAYCTTEAFLFDRKGVLRYHGRIDDNTYAPQAVKEHNLRDAIESLLANKPVKKPETKAFACALSRTSF